MSSHAGRFARGNLLEGPLFTTVPGEVFGEEAGHLWCSPFLEGPAFLFMAAGGISFLLGTRETVGGQCVPGSQGYDCVWGQIAGYLPGRFSGGRGHVHACVPVAGCTLYACGATMAFVDQLSPAFFTERPVKTRNILML